MDQNFDINCQISYISYISLEVRVITVFTVFRLLTDFVCLNTYEFWLSLCKIVRSSVILLLPLINIHLEKKIDLKTGFLRIFFWRFIEVKQTIINILSCSGVT